MDKQQTYPQLLNQNGTNQADRHEKMLSPDSVDIHGFKLNDWLQFVEHFALYVKHHDLNDGQQLIGDWQGFFKNTEEFNLFLQETEDKTPEEIALTLSKNEYFNYITPHLSLFITFLKLLQLAQRKLNQLTKKHLDFYFREILKLSQKQGTQDQVHFFAEPAHGILQFGIPGGALLDAGKDAEGKKLLYALNEELAVNRIRIAELKSAYRSFLINDKAAFKMAPAANSFDGKGTPFKGEQKSWFPFGYYDPQNSLSFPELPDAKTGFAISSKALLLEDGIRTITLTFTFSKLITAITAITEETPTFKLEDCFDVYLTGKEGWIKAEFLKPGIKSDSPLTEQREIVKDKLSLLIHLPAEAEGVFPYKKEIHGEQFDTNLPVIRFQFRYHEEEGRKLYEHLETSKATLKQIDLDVKVVDSKKLKISNDQSELKADKPFYPFTNNPIKGASFYIEHPEAFQKNLTSLELKLDWKNTPQDFREHYISYKKTIPNGIGTVADLDTRLMVRSNDHFKINVNLFNNPIQTPAHESEQVLFTESGDPLQTTYTKTTSEELKGLQKIKFSLKQSFLQELYPKIYTLAFINLAADKVLPNEPYIPLAENIRLNYDANDQLIFSLDQSKLDFEGRSLRFFHEHPFGQAEEHTYIKEQIQKISPDCYLFPKFNQGGELYIGLDEVRSRQQLSLLIQVDEGSENPLAESFSPQEKINWFVLCSNRWKKLDADLMVLNETDNFLKSGLLRIVIPEDANTQNTLLPRGLHWIKAVNDKNYDSVSKVQGIFTQAGRAALRNRENFSGHSIPEGSISKLVDRNPEIKAIMQPFNSFGGHAEEDDSSFYRRVSERLRHKNRSSSQWDYERLVLEEFPEIHRIKCLNHTSPESFQCAGAVTLVLIPDTAKKNSFDPFQPRVSKALLSKVQNFLESKKSLPVNIYTSNPDYEEILVKIKVKFLENLDESLYNNRLNEDLIKFLSPWAFNKESEIIFETVLQRNILLVYIEKLNYVDYVTDLQLFKNGELQQNSIQPASPKSILVSAHKHQVNISPISPST